MSAFVLVNRVPSGRRSFSFVALVFLVSCLFALSGPALAASGVLKPVEGGRPAPELKLSDTNGRIHDLATERGKVVLVQFWASYCPPCVKEMPSVDRLVQRMSGKPFAIYAVNMGEPGADIDAFLKRVPVNFPILLDPSGDAVQNWRVFAAPSTFVVDPQGRIRYTLFGGAEWDAPEYVQAIEGLMKDASAPATAEPAAH